MTNALTMLAEFDKYFQSMNRVPPEVRTSVPTAEWVALRDVLTALAAPAQPDGLAEFLQFRAEFRAWRDAQSAAPAQPNTWREAVLDALASTGGDMPATATPAEIVRAVIDAHVQIALDPRVSDAAPAQQPDEPMPEYLRDMITGMSVSVDVSTGEHDAGHRYFGTVTEVMDDSHDKFGVTLLVQDAEPNFKAPSVQHEKPAEVLLAVIQRLNSNPYSLTKSECIAEVQAMRDALAAAPKEQA